MDFIGCFSLKDSQVPVPFQLDSLEKMALRHRCEVLGVARDVNTCGGGSIETWLSNGSKMD
jgi:hypothetical protein